MSAPRFALPAAGKILYARLITSAFLESERIEPVVGPKGWIADPAAVESLSRRGARPLPWRRNRRVVQPARTEEVAVMLICALARPPIGIAILRYRAGVV